MASRTITIRTGARLHFGPLSFRPATGRHFGGIGVMIQEPGVFLSARIDDSLAADQARSGRASDLIARFTKRARQFHADDQSPLPPLVVDVVEEIPPHVGLGSGTQLSLAVLEATMLLSGRSLSVAELATGSERGERSAVGVFGYDRGGFLVDAGHWEGSQLGSLACRVDFPDDWRLLIVIPPDGQGLHGRGERLAFERLSAMPEEVSGALCRLTLTELLPALREEDFRCFVAGLDDYGRRVGEFFSPLQGGVLASAQMRSLAAELRRHKLSGIAQSSWGPAVAIVAEHPTHAAELRRLVETSPAAADCRIIETAARNTGREVTED